VASLAGFVTLTIAHNLALGGGDGDASRCARHQLAGHPRRGGHPRLRFDFRPGLLAILYIFLGLCTRLLPAPVGNEKLPPSWPSALRQAESSAERRQASWGRRHPAASQMDIGKALAE
jgi:hypothetical protein